jgi:sterol desaturase/sphingolipid hydroxylase (fatty acid hydroxylase superfamily)
MDALWTWMLDSYAHVSGDAEFVYFGPVSVWLSQVVTYVFFGVLFTFVDLFQYPQFIYRFKLQSKYPYDQKGNTRNPSLGKTLGIVLLAFITELGVLIVFQKVCHRMFDTGVFVTYAPPSWFDIAFAIIGLTILSEIGFYCTHRLLHEIPFLYRNVHKVHHSFNTPIALAAEGTSSVVSLKYFKLIFFVQRNIRLKWRCVRPLE